MSPRFASSRPDFRSHFFRILRRPRDADYVRAFRGKSQCNGAANASARSCDDRYLILQLFHAADV
jgi:hypothetical protein